MNCPKCNAWLPDDAAFCSECGQKIVAPAPAAPAKAFCSNCGAELIPGDAFCGNCGARAGAAPQAAPASAPKTPNNPPKAPKAAKAPRMPKELKNLKEKLPKKVVTIAGIVVAAILVVVILGSLFSGGKTNNYALYIKDGELQFAQMPKGKNPVEVTSKLMDGDYTDNHTQSQLYLDYYIQMSEDGKKLFFPDKVDVSYYGSVNEFTLYWRNVGSKKEAEKVDSGISSYSINDKGTLVTYKKDGNLYQNDLKDKEKVASDVAAYRVSDDGKTIIYLVREDNEESGNLYKKKGSKDAEKLASDVTSIRFVSEDFSTVMYSKEDSLYIKNGSKDAEKVASDVEDVMVYDTDAVYYTKTGEEFSLWDWVNDDMESDEYYDYYRESLKENTANMMELYFFNGKDSVLVTDQMIESYESYAGDEPAMAYMALMEGETPTMKLSDYVEDSYTAMEEFSEALMECCKAYIAMGDKTAELEFSVEDIYGVEFSADASVAYVGTEYDEDDDTVTLHKLELSGGKVKKSAMIDDEVYSSYRIVDETSVLYFKDLNDDYEGELYLNGEKIADDVYRWYCSYNAETDNLYYMVDWNDEKAQGTLTYSNGKKATTVKDDVHAYYFTPEGEVLFLYDYSMSSYKGELWIQNGKKSTKLDDDVVAVFIP